MIIQTPKTLDELVSLVGNVLPNAEFGEDNEGQVIVYTNLYQKPGKGGQLCLFEELEEGGSK
jgi:hypothetical protein